MWTKSKEKLHAILVFSAVKGRAADLSTEKEKLVRSWIGGSFGPGEYQCSACHFICSVGLKPASPRVSTLNHDPWTKRV